MGETPSEVLDPYLGDQEDHYKAAALVDQDIRKEGVHTEDGEDQGVLEDQDTLLAVQEHSLDKEVSQT